MALVIEDGTQVVGAASYVSAADATTYHAARGNSLWTGTDAVKEAALLKAAAYLDGHYRARWKGFMVDPLTQSMEWPRTGVSFPYSDGSGYCCFLPSNQIPQRLKDAQCELALRALSGDLSADAPAGIKREKVDVLETEYFPGAPTGQTAYAAVDQLLSDYLKPLGSGDLLRG